MNDEILTIPDHPALYNEMRDYNILGKPMTGKLGEISEWAARKALWDWPIGCQVTLEELSERALNIQLGISLNHMVDQGFMDMEWCEEHGEVTYSLTPGGKEWAKENTHD